jgi:hypothetical protein
MRQLESLVGADAFRDACATTKRSFGNASWSTIRCSTTDAGTWRDHA